MSWLSDIFSGGAQGVLKGAGELAKDLRTAITGEAVLTAEQKQELLLKASAMEEAAQKAAAEFDVVQMGGQIELNKLEAGSPSLYKSGWRPGAGWVCVAALAYDFLLRPLVPWVVAVASGRALAPMPELNMEALLTLLMGLLGLGTMRTLERIRGKAPA